MENSIIDPSGLTNFSDRFRFVIQMRLDRCIQNICFQKRNFHRFQIFKRETRQFSSSFEASHFYTCFELHRHACRKLLCGSFREKPSGYYSLESQAAPAALNFMVFSSSSSISMMKNVFQLLRALFSVAIRLPEGFILQLQKRTAKLLIFLRAAGC